MVDRATPAEALRATVTWSLGPPGAVATVDAAAAAALRSGRYDPPVGLVTGRAGAHLVTARLALGSGETSAWYVVADVAKDHAAVAELRHRLTSSHNLAADLEESLRAERAGLERKVAGADGLQWTGDERASVHHFANVLFNSMRGGVFTSGYHIPVADFAHFVAVRNRDVACRFGDFLSALPDGIERSELVAHVAATGDRNFERLATEYLPLSFSRRHGDPSRPWNAFSIRVKDDAGNPVYRYEGNWRDIFQNWEALCQSYPDYLPGVIALFVNASTPDGFNPYRITSAGIEWEVIDPEDPWSNIGYWGDHQIVYLLRLLEATDRLLPGSVGALLTRRMFTYADVPYRLVPYEEVVADPRATIHYDAEAAARIEERVAVAGYDGKLLWDDDGDVLAVTLLEKLVVPALSKLSNFVAGGGIWMNTQRPEWNDANNALVGNGLSMVTLYYLRRYLAWLATTCAAAGDVVVSISAEVAGWLEEVTDILRRHEHLVATDVNDRDRKALLDDLGGCFSRYRARVYRSGLSGTVDVGAAAVTALCEAALPHLDATIRRSRRPDGLYHSYNLIDFSLDGSAASVRHLEEMLEGQVAVLSSGVLDAEVSADVIDALFASSLFRADQASFMLYPERRLPSFSDKNVIPAERVAGNPLLSAMLAAGDGRIVTCDVEGDHHFNAGLSNSAALEEVLDRLGDEDEWRDLVVAHRAGVLDAYEGVFRHHAYTGRSGSMYAYEGLGSIYWHMVSKLLLAVQECVMSAHEGGAAPDVIERLRGDYFRVRAGLGFNKDAAEYGAFPTDPYSHTPAGVGAQQPGMTGQVKEEILTRPGELGVWVADGELCFDPILLRRRELLGEPAAWRVVDAAGVSETITLERGSLGLTVCQVPVTVTAGAGPPGISAVLADGSSRHIAGTRLGRDLTRAVFERTEAVARIEVRVAEADVTLD